MFGVSTCFLQVLVIPALRCTQIRAASLSLLHAAPPLVPSPCREAEEPNPIIQIRLDPMGVPPRQREKKGELVEQIVGK